MGKGLGILTCKDRCSTDAVMYAHRSIVAGLWAKLMCPTAASTESTCSCALPVIFVNIAVALLRKITIHLFVLLCTSIAPGVAAEVTACRTDVTLAVKLRWQDCERTLRNKLTSASTPSSGGSVLPGVSIRCPIRLPGMWTNRLLATLGCPPCRSSRRWPTSGLSW